MMTIFAWLLAAALQEAPPPPFRATLFIERSLKREDGVTLSDGALAVRPGEALAFTSGNARRPARLVIRDGRAVERRAGEPTARRWDLSRPGNFQAVDLWRLGPDALDDLFEVRRDRSAREIPERLEGRAPVAMPLRPSARVVAEGTDREAGCERLQLVPRDAALRARILGIRLSVDRATRRILSAVIESPAQRVTMTLGDVQEAASLEDEVFEMDLNGVNVEEQ